MMYVCKYVNIAAYIFHLPSASFTGASDNDDLGEFEISAEGKLTRQLRENERSTRH